MTWTLDPKNEWAKRWELENPEPHVDPQGYDDRGIICWTKQQVVERVQWHQKRWLEFQQTEVFKTFGKQYHNSTINSREWEEKGMA